MGDAVKTSTDRFSLRGFGLRLFALVTIVLLPVYGLLFFLYGEVRAQAKNDARENAASIVRVTDAGEQELVNGARLLLVTLSKVETVRPESAAECSALFKQLLEEYPLYANFAAASLDGNVYCSGLALPAPITIFDRSYFQETVKTRDFAVGDFQIGRVSKKSSVSFAYPTLDANGNVSGVVLASLDLEALKHFTQATRLPEGSVLTVFDRKGTILVRDPDPDGTLVGQDASATDLGKFELGITKESTAELVGADGIRRLYVAVPLKAGNRIGGYLSVGFPTEALYEAADRSFARNMAFLLLLTGAIYLIAYFAARRLVLDRVSALREVDRMKSEFVSLASHQLRTPLTAIRWSIDYVAGMKLPKAAKGPISDAERSTARLTELVSELLNIGRIETGRLRVRPKSTDLAAFVDESVKEVETLAREKDISIEVAASDLGKKVKVDPLLLRQVLGNFLTNAVHYTPRGGRVRVKLTREGAFARFEVADNGIGIPPEEQGKIFGRFFRAENARVMRDDGNGLGLYLAKTITERFGGNIGFDSKVGKGTTFWFTIPLAGVEASEGEAKAR